LEVFFKSLNLIPSGKKQVVYWVLIGRRIGRES
jgi:hypothetical protein